MSQSKNEVKSIMEPQVQSKPGSRLEVLKRYGILDSPREHQFDGIAALAAHICKAPIALISFVDQDRRWYKATFGWDIKEHPEQASLCIHPEKSFRITVVNDASTHPHLADHPFVKGDPFIRFYVGLPLVDESGFTLGELCVIDRLPRQLTDEQLESLCILRDQTVSQLQLRRNKAELEEALLKQDLSEKLLAGQNEVLEMIAENKPLTEILTKLVELIEGQTDGMIGSVLLVDELERHLLHGAAPRLPEEYCQAIHGIAIGPEMGSCGTAAYRKEAVIVEDIEHDSLWTKFRVLALYHDLKACWSTPILSSSGKVLGTFAMYYREPRKPTEFEKALTKAAAHLAGVAIEARRAKEYECNFKQELELRVQQRTVELEATNKALEAFSHSVSHELKGPLRSIEGFSDEIQIDEGNVLSDDSRQMLQSIVSNAKRMNQLICDLLTFSITSRHTIKRQQVDMNQVVTSVMDEFRAEIESRKVRVEVGEIPPCTGDGSLLRQVWSNLFSNALKFSAEQQCPRIIIRGSETFGESVYYIKDNGVGFAPKDICKLFQPFERLQSASKFPGTGLGLALVHNIVSRHGGDVWAEGTPGDGATFHFSLPSTNSNHALFDGFGAA